jgi:hypothetical protein
MLYAHVYARRRDVDNADSTTAPHNRKLHRRRTHAMGNSQRVETRTIDRLYPMLAAQAHCRLAFPDPITATR